MAVPPLRSIRRTQAAAASGSRSLHATRAPYLASASAMPLPMLGPAPVTSATRPSSDTSISALSVTYTAWHMGTFKTQAAVLLEPDGRWEITEVELDPPKANEVLIRFMASGLCHSDEHVRSHITKARLPMVGGHEGAGIIEEVGPGVTRVAKGDHVVCSYIPAC